ncbi:MAG TPA: ATP-binding protein, partial [Ktedonobacteraceae bacterium]|nr:ATP-binding protein [Ktedonobacteraceae bacterium]
MSEMRNIALAILKAKERHVTVPPLIERWAILVSGNIILQFEDHITSLLAEDNLNEAQSWIEAARWLETIVGAELTWVLERNARRLELRYRRSYDEQFLTRFLRRDEQIKAFTELLKGSNKCWALHYVGQGGVGKTMLMRYLTTRYFAEHNLQASICRIDFDYLNPDYPSRAPGLLLDQISQELRLYGGAGANKEFAHFDRLVRNLHERIGSSNIGNLLPDQMLADSDFDYLLQTFVRALRRLPQPIVLILDTCEELAKIRPDGTIPENVRATFAILERIHDDLPGLRVVFSGRRPLARAGCGWDCRTSLQPKRPYLLLHEIRGFTYDEAFHYLLGRAKVRAELIVPIIQKSLDNSIPIDRFHWWRKRDSATRRARYSPFDLALYASWVREDTSITVDDILAPGIDRYIERRIIGRIRHPRVQALLPAVALLGTFDRETLRIVAHSDERSFNAIFQELANQEWLQLQQFTFWRVKSGLRERLYSYYREHNPQALADARMLLLPYLERITLEWPLSSLNVSHFDAALRLLEEDDPQRAAAWWSRIETRFANEGNAYGWALTLIEQLLGEEGAVAEVDSLRAAQGRKESTLRPAVLATYASAQLHTRPSASREAT